MKKLDDIPKKHPFNVPDDYFETLPGKVQARVQGQSPEGVPVFGRVMRYAMAMIVVGAVGIFWLNISNHSNSDSPEAILASLETADLVAYLNEGDITTDELLDDIRFDNEDVNEIEGAVFNLNINDLDLNALENEID